MKSSQLALADIHESLIDNNIHIMLQFAKDMGPTGDKQQCVVGDQATRPSVISHNCIHSLFVFRSSMRMDGFIHRAIS